MPPEAMNAALAATGTDRNFRTRKRVTAHGSRTSKIRSGNVIT